MALNIKHK